MPPLPNTYRIIYQWLFSVRLIYSLNGTKIEAHLLVGGIFNGSHSLAGCLETGNIQKSILIKELFLGDQYCTVIFMYAKGSR